MVNKAEKRTGTFFEGRFKSIAMLDEEALLAVRAYIDLNPVAAGMARPRRPANTRRCVVYDFPTAGYTSKTPSH